MSSAPQKPVAAGKSSFSLLDPELAFDGLDLKPVRSVLDLGCGIGLYSLDLAKRLERGSMVYSLDLWPEGIDALNASLHQQGLDNIRPLVADASIRIPLRDASVDLCLLATVLHDFVQVNKHDAVLTEVRRVLKPAGTLVLIEFKKRESKPGPPIHIRLSEDEATAVLARHQFRPAGRSEPGEALYRMLFRLQ